jgi:hypothetical protein
MNKLTLIALLFGAASCQKPKAECITKPVDKTELTGKFAQYGYCDLKNPVISSSHHKFHFYSDSFKMEKHSIVTTPTNDSCKATAYYEYARGSWSLNNGQLLLFGVYTNPAYETKNSSCYPSGKFDLFYMVTRCNDTIAFSEAEKSVNAIITGIKLYKEQ